MNVALLNKVAQVAGTDNKTAAISAAIVAAMECGLELPAAVDFVLGEGFYARLASSIYHNLRNRQQ